MFKSPHKVLTRGYSICYDGYVGALVGAFFIERKKERI